MLTLSSLSFNIRQIIFSFLTFSEMKNLIFTNKKIFTEVLIFLKDQPLSIKQNEIFLLKANDLKFFLKRFPNITHLQLNCLKIDLFLIISSLPKSLKSLKLIEINLQDFFNPNLWNALSEKCSNLEIISFIIKFEKKGVEKEKALEDLSLQAFFKSNQSLRKFSLKFNKNDEIGIKKFSNIFMRFFLENLSSSANKIEVLVLHNIESDFFPFKLKCPHIKEIRIKKEFCEGDNNFSSKKSLGANFETMQSLYNIFPKLESIHILDYYPGNIKQAMSAFVKLYLEKKSFKHKMEIQQQNENEANKIDYINDLKKFNINIYGNHCEIDEITVMNLISNCSQLQSFSNSSNKFLSNGIIQELVMRNLHLTELNFDYTNIDDLSCSILASSQIIKNIKKLSVQFCKRISHEGFVLLLENCKSLISLNIKGCKNFKNKTVDSLLSCGELQKIYFHENRIKNNNFQKIVKRFAKSLKVIEISKIEGYEKFTNSFLGKLCEEKFRASNVKIFDVAFNHIIDITCIKDICEVFPNLESFNVKCCGHFNMDCIDYIKNSHWKFTLEKLNIKYCYLDGGQIEELCEKLKGFSKLMHIFVDDSHLKHENKFSNRFIFC